MIAKLPTRMSVGIPSLTVVALASNETPIICNGFKDAEFIEMAMLAQKIGRRIIPVVEKYTELQLILDELTDISKQLEEEKAAASALPDPAADTPTVDPSDPAASSPKRAKWLAEQERKAAPKSRRELLFRARDET